MDIRFYDNEYKNWDKDMNVHSEIGFMHVDDEIPNTLIQHIDLGSIKTQKDKNRVLNLEYIQHFANQNNTYALSLLGVVKNPSADPKEIAKIMEKDYPSNGIDTYLSNLEHWGSTDTKTKVLLLDWDRTVTAVEGFYTPALDDPSVLFDDVIQFVMGGEERLETYVRLFHKLHVEYDLPVFIITHNPNASLRSKHRQVYLRMLRRLLGSVSVELDENSMIICSTDHKYKKHLAVCATAVKQYLHACNTTSAEAVVAEPAPPVATTIPVETKTVGKKRKTMAKEIVAEEGEMLPPPPPTTSRKRRLGGKPKTKKIRLISRKTRKYVVKKKI